MQLDKFSEHKIGFFRLLVCLNNLSNKQRKFKHFYVYKAKEPWICQPCTLTHFTYVNV